MTTKNIEVELRGALNQSEYETLLAFLKERGTTVKKQNRFLLDFSTFLEGISERTLDVRVRVTNGKIEIVVKKGKFGGTSREESSIFPEAAILPDVLKFMSLIGYTKAVACDRGIERFLLGDIEIAIQDVRSFSRPGTIHSRFFEAEIMVDETGKELAVTKIREFLQVHNLKEFSEIEWSKYVETMNKEANGVFDYEKDDVSAVAELGK